MAVNTLLVLTKHPLFVFIFTALSQITLKLRLTTALLHYLPGFLAGWGSGTGCPVGSHSTFTHLGINSPQNIHGQVWACGALTTSFPGATDTKRASGGSGTETPAARSLAALCFLLQKGLPTHREGECQGKQLTSYLLQIAHFKCDILKKQKRLFSWLQIQILKQEGIW